MCAVDRPAVVFTSCYRPAQAVAGKQSKVVCSVLFCLFSLLFSLKVVCYLGYIAIGYFV